MVESEVLMRPRERTSSSPRTTSMITSTMESKRAVLIRPKKISSRKPTLTKPTVKMIDTSTP
jgi:hypothetical protein